MQLLSMIEFLDDGFDAVADFGWEKKLNNALESGNADSL